ncbi:reverse transcriptase [Gossypium australe]|uniref:Reverse transcriptase n=1 Tax=Gossypium australe TaxID=47621 RepID=A0A5B6V9W8_9ROSI|nr:reverse transcriptase [Gossypium australe]
MYKTSTAGECVTKESNDWLEEDYTESEIVQAITQMDPRFIYKVISKVLANRLKVALPNCISPNQSAFVPGRMIHDNILIAHKLFHYLQSPKNGPNKGLIVKLDMSKAYG